ncbi:MAG: M23 family metallopeptidase [Parvibaculaceae bacterium]
MHNDQSEKSRFETVAAAVSTAGDAFFRASRRLFREESASATSFNALGHRNRWGVTSAAVGALSLGMTAVAIGSLINPQTSTAHAVASDKAPVRVVASLPPLPPKPAAENSGFFDNPFTDDAAEAAASGAPLSFETAYALVTEPVRRTAKETVTVGRGDTLMALLTGAGAERLDAYHAIAAMKPLYDPRKLRAGQALELTFEEYAGEDENGTPETVRLLTAITMQTDVDREVAIRRTEEGEYSGLELIAELETGNVRARGTINSSLFLAASDAGVPPAITVELIRMYSYDIDFQREIRQGDTFEVFFTREYDENGTPVREGDVLYASMNVGGKERRLWRYEPADGGNWDYFDEQGRSMRKFLMKTPIDGARISSGFGNRRHPILGYTRLHSGTDFAAPRGTPIYAAGNGTIEMAQRNGGYGNYVRIRHANGYQTAYAHMNGFGRGIRKGVRVRQGQVIGYVGSTGRSTGPHLHYEVIRNGSKVNPQRIRVPTGRTLSGEELAAFQQARTSIDTMIASAPALTRVAEADIDN